MKITGYWKKKEAPDQTYITYRDGDNVFLTNGVCSWDATRERMEQLSYMGYRDNVVEALKNISSYLNETTRSWRSGALYDLRNDLNRAIELKAKEVKTRGDWHEFAECSGLSNWDDFCDKGDFVDDGMVDYFMDCIMPVSMTSKCSQLGEPKSSRIDEKTGRERNTYTTFTRVGKNKWRHCGDCFAGEIEERGKEIVYA